MSSSTNFKPSPHLDDGNKIVKEGNETARYHYKPIHAPHYEDEPAMMAPSVHSKIKAKRSMFFRIAQIMGVVASVAWIAVCVLYLVTQGGVSTQTPYELGIFVAGMLAPVAFYWMLLSYLQRNSDVQYYAESLRAEMHGLFFPSDTDSQRVNKDIERMTSQAAELAASSRAVLKSISRTRQGLRHEIKEFANFAGKAESHLIGLSSNLNDRVGNVAELVDEMEERIDLISQKSEGAITSWDEASAKMIERASDIEMQMDRGANNILAMAEVAQEKSHAVSEVLDGTITSLGLTVDAVVDRLGGMREDFGAYTRTLQISTEELAKETNRMGVMIEDNIGQMQDAAGRSVEMISNSLVEVGEQKKSLEETANNLSSKATLMTNAITQSVLSLNETADVIVSRAEATGEKLSDKTKLITQSLEGLEGQIGRIDSISQTASQRLGEGVESAIDGASQISNAVRSSIDDLTKASEDATTNANRLIETTLDHIHQLKETEEQSGVSLDKIVALLGETREQIDLSAITAQNHVDKLSQSGEAQSKQLEMSAVSLAEQVQKISKSLEEPMKMVSIAVADVDGRHNQIQETLNRRVSELNDASNKATQSVEVIRQTMREQTNEISTLSGQLISQSKTLNTQLHENKEMLSVTIDSSLSEMSRFMNDITDKTNVISGSSLNFAGKIMKATDTIDIMTAKLNEVGEKSTEILNATSEKFVQNIQTLDDKIQISEKIILTANDSLIKSSEQLLPLYSKVEVQSNSSNQVLKELRDSYSDVSELAVSKIELMTSNLDKTLAQLEEGTRQASTLMSTTTNDLSEKLSDINHVAGAANDKLRSVTNAMDAQSSDIHLLTDQAVLKIENISNVVNGQFQDLTTSVAHAVNQIGEAGLAFDSHAEKISTQTNVILDRFTATGDEAQVKAYELKQAVGNIAETTKNSVALMSDQLTMLNKNSDNSLTTISKISDSLSMKSQEIDMAMQSVLTQAKTYADDMRVQTREIAIESDKSAQSIANSVSTLSGAIENVHSKTQSVMVDISSANQSLYDQSGRFVMAVSKSAQAAEHATELFSKQTDNLLKASRVAVEKTTEIREAELQAGRETFFSSARFVLESLHSLSIDFVRVLDGDVADKDWKSYQKGDVSLFTSKLVNRLNDMPSDKIRSKYAEDGDFRNYVQKFMRQFEDILAQTDTVDRGAILGTTFAASDVGKIYRFLCNVTGRDNKVIKA